MSDDIERMDDEELIRRLEKIAEKAEGLMDQCDDTHREYVGRVVHLEEIEKQARTVAGELLFRSDDCERGERTWSLTEEGESLQVGDQDE
jgi:SMC interacting uncharacterized protein involved in chromosome segregation